MSGPVSPYKTQLEQKIQEALSPLYLSVVDETWKHVGHRGAAAGGGHFIVHVVSQQFTGVSLIDRNRMVFDLFKNEIGSAIHALSIRAQTVSEWERENRA